MPDNQPLTRIIYEIMLIPNKTLHKLLRKQIKSRNDEGQDTFQFRNQLSNGLSSFDIQYRIAHDIHKAPIREE